MGNKKKMNMSSLRDINSWILGEFHFVKKIKQNTILVPKAAIKLDQTRGICYALATSSVLEKLTCIPACKISVRTTNHPGIRNQKCVTAMHDMGMQ